MANIEGKLRNGVKMAKSAILLENEILEVFMKFHEPIILAKK